MTRRPKLLIVDDQDRYAELCHALMQQYDYATRCELAGPCWTCERRPGCALTHAHDHREAAEALLRHPDTDAVLLDLAFELPVERLAPSPEQDLKRRTAMQGLDILRQLRQQHRALPVVLMTERAALDYADAADALAADEYLTLAGSDAFDAQALSLLVERAVGRGGAAGATTAPGYVWGQAREMGRVRRDVLTLAQTSLPLLVLGETGTGKTKLAAEVLHPASGRRGRFIAVDLAALPGDLVAGELFGSARGAYSGAVDREGALEAADGGTLFIDEIGNLPLEAQRILLVALERGEVTRLGETRARPIDVKLLAATNTDLVAAVREKKFRGDLLSRLNPSVRLVLPSLRERIEDLPVLVGHFIERAFDRASDAALLARFAERVGLPARPKIGVEIEQTARGAAKMKTKAAAPRSRKQAGRRAQGAPEGIRFVLDRETYRDLAAHDWPGNLRELRNVLTTATLLTLAAALELSGRRRTASPLGAVLSVSRRAIRDLLSKKPDGEGAAPTGGDPPPQRSLHEVARFLERDHYQRLFEASGGRFEEMARRLLGRADAASARRVRLRYNQLGLRVRRPRSSS